MVSKNDHVETIFNIPVMVRDERKRGSSLKIPFKSLFGMFSPNLTTEKFLEKDDDQLVIAPRCLELNGVGVISEIVSASLCSVFLVLAFMKDSSSFPGSAASPETDYVNATLLGDDPWLKLKVELLLVYGYLPRPPENHSDFGSFTELVCMWLHPSGNLSFVDAAVIVECRDVCRKGELQLAQFRPNHVCGTIQLIKQMEIRYVLCSCLLTYLCHDKLHSLVKAHMRSMERNSQIPAIVDHILLIMIFDGVAMKFRYVGIHSTSLGFLYGLVPTKTNPDVFSSRFQYHEVSWSVCDFDFGLTLLLSSVSLSQRLSSHDYKLSFWSTSLVMQRMKKIQKQLRVVGFCCTPLEFLFGSLPWYLVDHPNPHDFTYGQGEFWFAPAIELLWFHDIWFVLLSLHEQQIIVKDGLWLLCTEMELVFSAKRPWVTPLCFELVHFNERPMVQQNQVCLKSLPSQEGAAIRVSTELISVTRTWSLHGFLLFTVMLNANGDEDFAKRWTMFHNGCHVLIQSQNRDFEFIGHIIAACSGGFESFLTFFYGSSPRPPDDRCALGFTPLEYAMELSRT